MAVADKKIQRMLSVPEIMQAYYQTKADLENHFQAIKALVDHAESIGIMPGGAYRVTDLAARMQRELRQYTWLALINSSGLERVLPVSRMQKLDKMIFPGYGEDVPEPSEKAIYDLLNEGTVKTLLQEMVREVFDFLRPGVFGKALPHNRKHAASFVGKKVILEHVVYDRKFYIDFPPEKRRHLVQMDRLFHLLDGKPFPFQGTYNSPLVDGLVAAKEGQTDYFRWRRYQNGNLHLTFLREDLRKKLNQMAGELVEPALGEGIK